MSSNDEQQATGADTEPAKPTIKRVFIFNGGLLGDPGAAFSPEQVRDIWAGTYPDLQNAKVKGPDKKTLPDGSEEWTYTFAMNVGRLG
ncbi:MAG TPA: PRTRC system protein C [Longimicrobium sp.]|nr:PRTRC system protein C [Longimicrobium sp.]